jgi:tRNA(fMet)-specific endonuclease VapC
MGLMVDTNVFIYFEKSGKVIDFSPWGHAGPGSVSVVTVSELLIGVHRADTEDRRKRRSAFVEAVISGGLVLDFTIDCARLHAELSAELAKAGRMIGPHDSMIAATALRHDLAILTDNVGEFSRVPGLHVIPFVS